MKVTIKLDQEQFDFINTSLVTIASQLALLVRAWEGPKQSAGDQSTEKPGNVAKKAQEEPTSTATGVMYPKNRKPATKWEGWTKEMDKFIESCRANGECYADISRKMKLKYGKDIPVETLYTRMRRIRQKESAPAMRKARKHEHYLQYSTIFNRAGFDKPRNTRYGGPKSTIRALVRETGADWIEDRSNCRIYVNKRDADRVIARLAQERIRR